MFCSNGLTLAYSFSDFKNIVSAWWTKIPYYQIEWDNFWHWLAGYFFFSCLQIFQTPLKHGKIFANPIYCKLLCFVCYVFTMLYSTVTTQCMRQPRKEGSKGSASQYYDWPLSTMTAWLCLCVSLLSFSLRCQWARVPHMMMTVITHQVGKDQQEDIHFRHSLIKLF